MVLAFRRDDLKTRDMFHRIWTALRTAHAARAWVLRTVLGERDEGSRLWWRTRDLDWCAGRTFVLSLPLFILGGAAFLLGIARGRRARSADNALPTGPTSRLPT